MLRVLSFNIWGLPNLFFWDLTPFRERRIRSICRELSKKNWDFVLIQEAWLGRDRELLKNCGYPYCLDLDQGSQQLGSGLLVLSRHPFNLSSVSRVAFMQNGSVARCLFDGEYFAKKSVLMAQFVHPEIGPLWMANTHLVSSGGRRDRYRGQRLAQIQQLIDVIKPKALHNPYILGGDFNCQPGSEEWQLLMNGLDSFSSHHWESLPHTYRGESGFSAHLDHIFLSPHFEHIESTVQFTDSINSEGRPVRFSDHLALESFIRPVLDSV
jgi:endonuclease/exonuclease/phosphatase family metal-dependent hydrolase